MVTPEQTIKANADAQEQRQRIEAYFDRRLLAAQWDADGRTLIQRTRSGWLKENIDAVFDKYRAAGWKIVETHAGFQFERGAEQTAETARAQDLTASSGP